MRHSSGYDDTAIIGSAVGFPLRGRGGGVGVLPDIKREPSVATPF